MRIGLLTSSRADFGIYTPLIYQLETDPEIELEIIIFGMHLIEDQGNTKNFIENQFPKSVKTIISTNINGDSPQDIAANYGEIIKLFSSFWSQNIFDLLITLGDRWEMSAAVQSSIPFKMKIAHFHGGETTLGAIDNIYRHQISLASSIHFTCHDQYSKRLSEILGNSANIYNKGSLSLYDLEKIQLPEWDKLKNTLGIPFEDFILLTIHPETNSNISIKEQLSCARSILDSIVKSDNLLITYSNVDHYGQQFNKLFLEFQKEYPSKVKVFKALGRLNYFRCVSKCKFLVGNTSSGIIEAASFNKYVINIGDRQKGRILGKNILQIGWSVKDFKQAEKSLNLNNPIFINPFYKENSLTEIIEILKQ